ncbi:MAG: hypothetical protein AB2L07_18960 [Thermoanaerobaculaceae bacterium]
MNDAALEAAWRAAWPEALAAWSSYTLLREPVYAHSKGVARDAGFGGGELAAIRLLDQAVIVNFERIRALGLQADAKAILAHEIGHHVFVPGNLTDNARLLATIGKALPGLPEPTAMMVANLWADLLINDRLQRGGRADMAAVYRRLAVPEADAAWTVYTRTMEHLWRLPAGTLTPKDVSPEQDADAALLARIVRAFASDWLAGARRFAAVLYPHLAKDLETKREARAQAAGLGDLQKAGSAPPGEKDAEAIPDGPHEHRARRGGGRDRRPPPRPRGQRSAAAERAVQDPIRGAVPAAVPVRGSSCGPSASRSTTRRSPPATTASGRCRTSSRFPTRRVPRRRGSAPGGARALAARGAARAPRRLPVGAGLPRARPRRLDRAARLRGDAGVRGGAQAGRPRHLRGLLRQHAQPRGRALVPRPRRDDPGAVGAAGRRARPRHAVVGRRTVRRDQGVHPRREAGCWR